MIELRIYQKKELSEKELSGGENKKRFV
jgi:hypothetical protein